MLKADLLAPGVISVRVRNSGNTHWRTLTLVNTHMPSMGDFQVSHSAEVSRSVEATYEGTISEPKACAMHATCCGMLSTAFDRRVPEGPNAFETFDSCKCWPVKP